MLFVLFVVDYWGGRREPARCFKPKRIIIMRRNAESYTQLRDEAQNETLDTLPDDPLEELPDFDEHGVLPPGDYAPTRADFEQRFVDFGDHSCQKINL